MASSSKDEERTKLERFDGTEPSTYKKWRRKAELMLLSLPTTYEKNRWGPKLCEYISGEAEVPEDQADGDPDVPEGVLLQERDQAG